MTYILRQDSLELKTDGRGALELTESVQRSVSGFHIHTGLCHVFLRHTSASLMLSENADSTVLSDLERWMTDAIPDGDSRFAHDAEGPDDMPAHVRTVLTGSDLSIPVTEGRLALGTWQGIYLWEHRTAPHLRCIIVTVQGEVAA